MRHAQVQPLADLIREELVRRDPALAIHDSYDVRLLDDALQFLANPRSKWRRAVEPEAFFNWYDYDRLEVICDVAETVSSDIVDPAHLGRLKEIVKQYRDKQEALQLLHTRTAIRAAP